MEAARALTMSVEEYLEFERTSEERHEFIDGEVHAVSGSSEAHNRVAGNIFAALHSRLRGGKWSVYMNDFKVRLEVARRDVFYYPDVVVSCRPSGIERYYLRLPTVVFGKRR